MHIPLTRAKLGPFGRFLIAGAVNTLLTYALFVILSSFLNYGIAYTISYVCGIALAYCLAAIFVFGTGLHVRSALRFPTVYLVQYLYGIVVLSILIDGLHETRHLALLVVIVTSIPLTFVLTKCVVKPAGEPQVFEARHDRRGRN